MSIYVYENYGETGGERMFNKKILFFLLTATCLLFLNSNCLAQVSMEPVLLSSSNIISPGSVQVSLDGRKIHPVLLKEDGVIYVRASELLSTFGYKYNYDRKLGIIRISGVELPAWRAGYINQNGTMDIYLPLLETLSLLEKRYLYSDLYGKDVISIRTDEYADYYNIPVYMEPSKNSNPQVSVSSDPSKSNININVNVSNSQSNQQTMDQGYAYGRGYALPDVPGYNSPITSVPDLLANCQYNNEVRGYGIRTRLGHFSNFSCTGWPYNNWGWRPCRRGWDWGYPTIYTPTLPLPMY